MKETMQRAQDMTFDFSWGAGEDSDAKEKKNAPPVSPKRNPPAVAPRAKK